MCGVHLSEGEKEVWGSLSDSVTTRDGGAGFLSRVMGGDSTLGPSSRSCKRLYGSRSECVVGN